MSDYTPAEILEGLRNANEGGWTDIYWDELGWSLHRRDNAPGGIYLRNELVDVTIVDIVSGGEGDYDIGTYVIIGVGDQYFKKTGHYMSHYGDDWDGPFTEVHPVEKTVLVYE